MPSHWVPGDPEVGRDPSPRSERGLGRFWPTCSVCGRWTGESSSRRAWGPGLRPSSGHRWREPCLPPRYCTGSPEFEPEVIIPAGISSVVAYCTFGICFGWDPLFATAAHHFTNPLQLGPYLILALWMIVLAMVYVRTFYGIQHLFHRLWLPSYLKPALGAFATGLVALGLYRLLAENRDVLAVLSFGYGFLQRALAQEAGLTASLFLAVALGKLLTTSLTIGSGGSGGVFGPSMVIGGSGAAALAVTLHDFWPNLVPNPASFVIVGMAGFFAAAAKTPFSTMVIVSEITGDYNLLLPALWVCSLTFLFSDQQSIYSSQVESRAQSPAHQGGYVHEILATVHLQQLIRLAHENTVLRIEDPLATMIARFAASSSQALPVVDEHRRLLGMVSLEEVRLANKSSGVQHKVRAKDLMRTGITPLQSQDHLDRALELFVENELPVLPVVNSTREKRVIGIIRRSDVAQAYMEVLNGQSRA